MIVVDSAKAAKVKLFIWSSIESIAQVSNNKYRVSAFESKFAITEYLAASSLPYALVPCGSYLSNIMNTGLNVSEKQEDGTYMYWVPVSVQTKLPIIDARKDYGAYVRKVIENPELGAGSEVLTGVYTSFEEQMSALSACKLFLCY